MAPSVYCHMRTRATSVWTLNNCFAALVCPYHELGTVLANLGIGTGAQSCFASTRQGYGSSSYSAKGFSHSSIQWSIFCPFYLSCWSQHFLSSSNLDMLFFSNREGWWLFACWVSIPGSCAWGVIHNPCGISFNDRAAVVFAGSCQPRGGHLFFSFSPIWRLLDGLMRAVVIFDADINFHNGVGAFRRRSAHQTGLSQNVKCWRAECPNSKHLYSHHHLQLLFHLTMRSNDPSYFLQAIHPLFCSDLLAPTGELPFLLQPRVLQVYQYAASQFNSVRSKVLLWFSERIKFAGVCVHNEIQAS